jgi:hypothetical protein
MQIISTPNECSANCDSQHRLVLKAASNVGTPADDCTGHLLSVAAGTNTGKQDSQHKPALNQVLATLLMHMQALTVSISVSTRPKCGHASSSLCWPPPKCPARQEHKHMHAGQSAHS